jgi:hypothetical protein
MQAKITQQRPSLAAAGQKIMARPSHSAHYSQNVNARERLSGSLPRWPWRPPEFYWHDLVVRGGGGFLAGTSAGLVSHDDQASRHFLGAAAYLIYANCKGISRNFNTIFTHACCRVLLGHEHFHEQNTSLSRSLTASSG